MRAFAFAAALGFVAVVGAFHTPYRPEQSAFEPRANPATGAN